MNDSMNKKKFYDYFFDSYYKIAGKLYITVWDK
jgi:hypothetical protein